MNAYSGIAAQADRHAANHRRQANLNRQIAGQALTRTGHTPMTAVWESNRPEIDGYRDHYLSEAERFDALADRWQERADAAREGRILRTANDPPGWCGLLPITYQ